MRTFTIRFGAIPLTILVLTLMISSCSDQDVPDQEVAVLDTLTQSMPAWIMQPPDEVAGTLSTVATGESKLEAVVNALSELAVQNDAKTTSLIKEYGDEGTETASDIGKSIAAFTIGNIEIKSISKQIVESNKQGQETNSYFEENIQITLQKDTTEFEMKYYSEVTYRDEHESRSHFLQVVGNNSDFNDLLQELTDSGVKLKTYEDENSYYVLMEYRDGASGK